MATHSSILARIIPWTEEPGGLVYGVAKNQARLSTHTHESKYSRLSRLSFLHWEPECGRNHILLHFTLEYLMFLQLMKANLRDQIHCLPAKNLRGLSFKAMKWLSLIFFYLSVEISYHPSLACLGSTVL